PSVCRRGLLPGLAVLLRGTEHGEPGVRHLPGLSRAAPNLHPGGPGLLGRPEPGPVPLRRVAAGALLPALFENRPPDSRDPGAVLAALLPGQFRPPTGRGDHLAVVKAWSGGPKPPVIRVAHSGTCREQSYLETDSPKNLPISSFMH